MEMENEVKAWRGESIPEQWDSVTFEGVLIGYVWGFKNEVKVGSDNFELDKFYMFADSEGYLLGTDSFIPVFVFQDVKETIRLLQNNKLKRIFDHERYARRFRVARLMNDYRKRKKINGAFDWFFGGKDYAGANQFS